VAEITAPVVLCRDDGRLNPSAVGWTRHPLHVANLRGWGRTKRWEHWCLVAHDVIVGVTVSSLDYAGVHSIYVLDRASGTDHEHTVVEPLARSTSLPERCGVGTARARGRDMTFELGATAAGTRLAVDGRGVRLRALVTATGQESLGVVVPWSPTRFQYTVKDVGRPLSGTLGLGQRSYDLGGPDAFAVLDHGRGRWPYSVSWNWAAGAGTILGRRIGLQLGGRWTDGTGQTENAVLVDGRVNHLHEELVWKYDRADFTKPWYMNGHRAEVVFAPFHERVSRTNLVVVASETHQCFGRFAGWILDDSGHRVAVDGLVGWAEEARHRW
jgi:hypothetical protein